MQLKLDQLSSHLARGLQSLYVLYGDEHLLAIEAADQVRAAARKAGYSEREVLVNDRSFRWGELLAAGQSMSLFGDRKLIDLRLPTGKPGKEGSQALQDFVALANPDVLTLISLPRLDGMTKNSAWFTALDKAGVMIEVPLVERTRLPGWIANRMSLQQQSTVANALEFMADRVEGNLLAAHQEIQKLGLLYPAGVMTLEQVQEAVLNVARYDVFKLTEAMLAGDSARVARMLDGLKAEGESAVLVHWTLTEEIRNLLRAQTGLKQGQALPGLLRQLRVWGPRERLYEGALRRIKTVRLRSALRKAAELDKLIKGLSVPGMGNAWDELMRLSLMLAH
jgi:DNA polymerase-3 subunit delta